MQTARTTSTPAITRRAPGRPGKVLGLLFGLLFFIPVFGMAVAAGLGALMGKLTRTGIDRAFRHQVRDLVKPGTSATFLMLEKVTPGQGGGELRDPAASNN